jgi:hypothetical protein
VQGGGACAAEPAPRRQKYATRHGALTADVPAGSRYPQSNENIMLVGTIVMFRGNSGTIRVAEGQDRKSDLVVHRSACIDFQPSAGDHVTFDVGKNKRGEICATQVALRAAVHRSQVNRDSPQASAAVMKILGHRP